MRIDLLVMITLPIFTSGLVSIAVLFLITIHEVAGGWIEPRGTVNTIQDASDAKRRIFPLRHLKYTKI